MFSISTSFDIECEKPVSLEEFDVSMSRMFVVLIENEVDGEIKIITDGKSRVVGEVVVPVEKALTIPDELWSAHYIGGSNGSKGGVVYSGGDSIIVRCGPNRSYDLEKPGNWKTSGIKIVPFTEEEVATDGDLVVGCPGGEVIFNEWSPYVGNSVYAMEKNGTWKTLDTYFASSTRTAPKLIMIDVTRPSKKLSYVEFENWTEGETIRGQTMDEPGSVYVRWDGQERKKVGVVLKKLESHENIPGSEYAEIGQVCSVTPGEIILSTSGWYGFIEEDIDGYLRGGVKIIPVNHAIFMDSYIKDSNLIGDGSVMIIGHPDSSKLDLERQSILEDGEIVIPPFMGLPPFFNGFIRPRFEQSDYTSSFRYYVSDDFGRSWRTTSEVNGELDDSGKSRVRYWTNIRIMIGK